MTPKRGDRVAPPADPAGGWDLRFATTDAVKGWDALSQQAPANTLTAWHELRSRSDNPATTPRHHQLKGTLATATHGGVTMPQWQ